MPPAWTLRTIRISCHIPDPRRSRGRARLSRAGRAAPAPADVPRRRASAPGSEEMSRTAVRRTAAEADARLAAEACRLRRALARLCKATPAGGVALEGWDDLLPILAEWEGPPVTAITLGLTNPPDLAFEHGGTHQPDLLLGLYSDEALPFSQREQGRSPRRVRRRNFRAGPAPKRMSNSIAPSPASTR